MFSNSYSLSPLYLKGIIIKLNRKIRNYLEYVLVSSYSRHVVAL